MSYIVPLYHCLRFKMSDKKELDLLFVSTGPRSSYGVRTSHLITDTLEAGKTGILFSDEEICCQNEELFCE